MKPRRKSLNIKGHLPMAKNQFGYEKYTQDSEEHLKGSIISLNNRFPNLVGFGILQYLKQLMAINPRCKIAWDEDNITALAHQMNVERKLLVEVVDYCLKQAKILQLTRSWFETEMSEVFYLLYPEFMEELITLQVKKLQDEATKVPNFYGNPELGDETEAARKTRMLEEMDKFLVLTDIMKNKVQNYYPNFGDPEDLWNEFKEEINKNYLKWYQVTAKDNYESNFYVFLNRRRATKEMLMGGEI